MTDIEKVRMFGSDVPQYAKEEIILDGDTTSLQLYYHPVQSDTVIITGDLITDEDPAPEFTVDDDTGVITFTDGSPDAAKITIEYKHVNLRDEAIQSILDDVADGDVRLAAASVLDIIASDQAMILKKMTILDTQTDGPAVAKALRDHAAILRAQVLSDEESFDIIEMIYDEPGMAEKRAKDWCAGL